MATIFESMDAIRDVVTASRKLLDRNSVKRDGSATVFLRTDRDEMAVNILECASWMERLIGSKIKVIYTGTCAQGE